jgi:uncharacterized protein YndB with AHSA1/START domain
METIHYSISHTIRKPREEVFNAVFDPDILSTYFTKASSGPLVSGSKVIWTWVNDTQESFFVENAIPNEMIEGHWEAWKVDYHVKTKFEFTTKDDGSTLVRLTESGFKNDELGRMSAFGQCNGWTDMLLCLKARLEFNIDLR